MMVAALLVLGSVGVQAEDIHCDLIEFNTLWRMEVNEGAGNHGEDRYRLVLSNQYWNLWDFYGHPENCYHVVAYMQHFPGREVTVVDGRYVLKIRLQGRMRRIIARVYLVTHCLLEEDPEVLDRKRWGRNRRRAIPGLTILSNEDLGLTRVLSSDRLVASDSWRDGWLQGTRKDGRLSIRSAMNCGDWDSMSSVPLDPKGLSISLPVGAGSSWPSSASGMESSPGRSGTAYARQRRRFRQHLSLHSSLVGLSSTS